MKSLLLYCVFLYKPQASETYNTTAVRRLRFWGIDMNPTISRVAEVLIYLLGVPPDHIKFHDLSPYCIKAVEGDIVSCQVPKPFTPYEKGYAETREDMHDALKEMAMISTWNHENASRVLRLFKTNEDFQAADVIVCTVVQSICSVLGASGKAMVMLPSWYFDHRQENDCRFTQQYTDLILCSVQQPPGTCQQPFLSSRQIVMATTRFSQYYVNHTLGLEIPLLSHGLPSMHWHYAAYHQYDLKYAEQASDPFLMWPQTKWKDHPSFKPLAEKLLELKSRMGRFTLPDAGQLYGTYTREQILQHRGVVILPYAEWSLTASELYWAGVPLFVPHIDQWFGQVGISPYYWKDGQQVQGPVDSWIVGRNVLWSFLAGPQTRTCYGARSKLSSANSSIHELVGDAEWNSWDTFAEKCAELKKQYGEPPFICFWNPRLSDIAETEDWVKTMWYYNVPGIQYWLTPLDLEMKLASWTWEDTLRHRETMRSYLEEDLSRVRDNLGSQLSLLAEEMFDVEKPREQKSWK